MTLPAWGIAILVAYPLLQIPAVLLIARYCEVDAAHLPTPPMRAFWTEEAPGDGSSDGDEAITVGDTPTTDDASAGDIALTVEGVRCEHCGEGNDPSFSHCRNCVARL